jgi:hypothetical protein
MMILKCERSATFCRPEASCKGHAVVYYPPMYAALFAATVGCFMGLLIPVSFARDALKLSPVTPANYDAVETELDKIPPELESAQCGGWDDRSVAGTIATVSGVPGRNGIWNGDILSGMATRAAEDLIFPTDATGLTTACAADTTEITKTVWRVKDGGQVSLDGSPEYEQVTITFPHPKFSDPSCRWRLKNYPPDTAPDVPLKPIGEYDPRPEYEEQQEEGKDRQSPQMCEGFCSYINTWQYKDCLDVGTAFDPITGAVFSICLREGNRYLCSDQEVKDAAGACNSNTGDKANSRLCKGEECRCEEDSGPIPGNQCVENPGTKAQEAIVYYSYYRRYTGSYTRDSVDTDDGDDKASDSAQVACYGFYAEFDPKTHRTEANDRRCVVNIDVSGRRDSQTGKGEYGQNSTYVDRDRDPNRDQNQRTAPGENRIPGTFNGEKDLWYLKLGGGFSLLNEKVFSDDYKNDLTNVFLDVKALDTASMRATEQLDTNTPFATGSYIRAFDDTGIRSVASWWQTQQSAVASMLHPPVIRMILPSGWAFGIDTDDPFLTQNGITILKPADKREDRIEVQINAQDDTLGAALAYLRRSLLLHVIEEPIPVVVPVGSAVEFRAKAEAWCAWFMQKNHTQNCDDAPAEVRTLINTLETYATDIDQYRLLRAELALYAAKVLNIQQSVTKPVSDWMVANINAYQEFLTQQRLLQAGLSQEWRKVQEKMEMFGSTTNMPWCMNQRFTLPVYSLLDEWLPARADNGSRSADKLPVIGTDANADIVIDLSAVAFMSGTIVLPVLQPVQVRITDFESPPAVQNEKELPDSYPELPSITAIQDALKRSAETLPKPYSSSGSVIPPIALKPVDRVAVEARLEAMRKTTETVDAMNDRYKKFWMSIGPFKPNDPDPEFDINNKKSVAYKKPKLECLSWDDSTCQHVEMDLRERFMRIASRPLVFLKEDYTSKDQARGIGGPCVTQHDVCSPIHPEEGGEKHLWEIIGPRNIDEALDELRTDVRNATLPDPVGEIPRADFPKYGTTTGNLLPTYNVPRAIDLFPPASSSSSSSSVR